MKKILCFFLAGFVVYSCGDGGTRTNKASSSSSVVSTSSDTTITVTDYTGVYQGDSTYTGCDNLTSRSRSFSIYQVGTQFVGYVNGPLATCLTMIDLTGNVSSGGAIPDFVKCNGASEAGRTCSASRELGTGTFSGNTAGSTLTFSYTQEGGTCTESATLTKTADVLDPSECGDISSFF